MSNPGQRTLLDAMWESFASSLRAPEGVEEPVALIWADGDSQWKTIVSAFKSGGRRFYELGPYAPDEFSGPAIWLKCIVDRTLPEVSPETGVKPVLYLPGVGRQELRAGDECPRYLEPLVELQYRGKVWHQRNGRDWTVEAFLSSDDVGLDIAQGAATQSAMLRSLPLLATSSLASLRGRRLEAEDFDALSIGDSIRDMLLWMTSSEAFKATSDGARWASFTSICTRDFKLDPDSDGPQDAADKLLHGGGKWDEVWRRFCDAPQLYYGVSKLLRNSTPRTFLVDAFRRPSLNDEREDLLCKELEAALILPHSSSCERIVTLDSEHCERRSWVWAQLGESPYAVALEPLARLAKAVKLPLGGASAEAMATEYAASGWRCDRAAIDSLNSVKAVKEVNLVTRVVRTLYEPWLDRSARRFQELMSAAGPSLAKLSLGVNSERDTCIVFVDGLRFDLGAMLQQKLEIMGYRARLFHRISPVPTVTATAKPLASPVHSLCFGPEDVADFAPVIASNGAPMTAVRLRDAMTKQGVDILVPYEVRMATAGDGGGWTEVAQIDTLGHEIGILLLSHLGAQIDIIVDRITSLLDCGWLRVRVVTDHGWLLLPGGLPKFELPPSVVESKWARCAAVQGESHVTAPTFPWHWNAALRIASPPGIAAFRLSTVYAHGGVSLQESVIPELTVERGQDTVTAKIIAVTWRGMRCRVSVDANMEGLLVDLRLNLKQSGSSVVASAKVLETDGEVSFAVPDDSHEGAAATVVVLDLQGHVLDYKTTTVGEKA